jgi:hypothetical protein
MAQHKKCKYQGLGYINHKGKHKCICDRTGEAVAKAYCINHCEDYQPIKKECEEVVITISK